MRRSRINLILNIGRISVASRSAEAFDAGSKWLRVSLYR